MRPETELGAIIKTINYSPTDTPINRHENFLEKPQGQARIAKFHPNQTAEK